MRAGFLPSTTLVSLAAAAGPPGPCPDPVPIAFGDTECGAIEIGETHCYGFDAASGDVILIQVSRLGVGIEPRLELYDPDGVFVSAGAADQDSAQLLDHVLESTGTYTLRIFDLKNDRAGGYCVHVQRPSNPGAAEPWTPGAVYCDGLGAPGDMDAYQFDAEADDVVWIRMQDAGPVHPALRLYDPSGTIINIDITNPSVAQLVDFHLPVTGTYTLLVHDAPFMLFGSYCVWMERVNAPFASSELPVGPVACGVFDGSLQVDVFEFDGPAGSAVRVRMTETAGQIEPVLRLYDPDGTLLATDVSAVIAEITAPVDRDGPYVLLAHDDESNDAGAYRLEVEPCGDGPCSPFCDSDANDDGVVNEVDLLDLVRAWGECACCDEDTIGFGFVSVIDLVELLTSWGPCPG